MQGQQNKKKVPEEFVKKKSKPHFFTVSNFPPKIVPFFKGMRKIMVETDRSEMEL